MRPVVALRAGEDGGAPGPLDNAAEDAELGCGIWLVPFGDQFQKAGAGIPHAHGDAGELFLLSPQGGGIVTLE